MSLFKYFIFIVYETRKLFRIKINANFILDENLININQISINKIMKESSVNGEKYGRTWFVIILIITIYKPYVSVPGYLINIWLFIFANN